MTSTSVECAQVLTVRSVPSRAASPTSPPFSRNHRPVPLQTLADLSDYLAPSQACLKPVTYVPDEQAEANELDKPAAAAAVRGVLSFESPHPPNHSADTWLLAGRDHHWRGFELLRTGSRRGEGQKVEKGRDHFERLPGLFVSNYLRCSAVNNMPLASGGEMN